MATETTTSTLAKTTLRQKLAHFQDENKGFYYESDLVKDDQGYHVKVLADFTIEPDIESGKQRVYILAPFEHQPNEDPELIATSDAMQELVEAVNEAITDSLDDAETVEFQDWTTTDSRDYGEDQEEPRIIKDRQVVYDREKL